MSAPLDALARRQRRVRRAILLAPWLLLAAGLFLLGADARPGPREWVLLAVFLALDGVGIQVGYHRLFAHASFKAHPAVRGVLVALGSMACHGPVFGWVVIHRHHHASADGPEDFHTPHGRGEGASGILRGLWHAQTGWLWNAQLDLKRHLAVADLVKDPVVYALGRVPVYYAWGALGMILPALAGALAERTWQGAVRGFLWGGPVRVLLSLNISYAINSLSHSVGMRRYDTPDESRDNPVLALLAFGAWQNTHHAFGSAYTTQFAWWQLDPGGWIIRTLAAAGLAWDLRRPTEAEIAAKRLP